MQPGKPLIFVSCGQSTEAERRLGRNICELIRELRPDVEPYFADNIELTTDGFIVNRLFDPSGQAAISPSIVIHEQYTVTSSGPYKIMEWRTDRQ